MPEQMMYMIVFNNYSPHVRLARNLSQIFDRRLISHNTLHRWSLSQMQCKQVKRWKAKTRGKMWLCSWRRAYDYTHKTVDMCMNVLMKA